MVISRPRRREERAWARWDLRAVILVMMAMALQLLGFGVWVVDRLEVVVVVEVAE